VTVVIDQLEDRTMLSALVVNNGTDSHVDGEFSLREAVGQANTDATDGISDAIQFDPSLSGATIVLTQGPLWLYGAGGGAITIDASGLSSPITVSGNNSSEVFTVGNAGHVVQAALVGLIIDNGNANLGGAIDNFGILSVSNCTVSGNTASVSGGGIENYEGTLTLNNLTISGNSAPNGKGGGIDNYQGTLTVSNSTISGNSAPDGYGGGIDNQNSGTLTVNNCTISGNSATGSVMVQGGLVIGSGGGIGNYIGTMEVTNSTVSNNTAVDGGGISNGAFSNTLTVSNSTISGNSALASGFSEILGCGGGIYSQGTLTLNNCAMSTNSAESYGGGIFNSRGCALTLGNSTVSGNSSAYDAGAIENVGTATLSGATISDNSAGSGGGIENNGTLTVSNCTISGNSATLSVTGGGNVPGSGGGIVNAVFGDVPSVGTLVMTNTTVSGNSGYEGGGIASYFGALTISNSTISGNSAKIGGGIEDAEGSTLELLNTIVAQNIAATGPDIGGSITQDDGYNLLGTAVDNTTTDPSPGPNDIFSDTPGLGPLSIYGGPTKTMALLSGSPAIGAGNPNAPNLPATDQRGFPRLDNGSLDIGAYQTQFPDQLAITTQPRSAITAGQMFDVKVSAKDPSGNVDPNFDGPVTIALGNNPGSSTLGGTLTVDAVAGVADFSDLMLDELGTGYTLQASSAGLGPVTTTAFNVIGGLTPAQIRTAYGLNSLPFNANGDPTYDGSGQTIAIVDAYYDPNIWTDVDTFDQTFGLTPSGPTLYDQYGAAQSFLAVFNQNGQVFPLPNPNPVQSLLTLNWMEEEALDVEWAHAIAPRARIDLIACNAPGPSVFASLMQNLMDGVAAASSLPGVSVVSMSWGQTEFFWNNFGPGNEAAFDAYFAKPGITFVAATGDNGAPGLYPAYSPNVVAVGGTTLKIKPDGSYGGETAWGQSGYGVSTVESEPQYQQSVQTSGYRSIPDVSFDAGAGVALADSYDFPASDPWAARGGTSLSAPCWAGLIAIVNEGRAATGKTPLNSSTPTYTLGALYSSVSSNAFNASGYNPVTGLGSPIANRLIPDLINFAPHTATTIATSTGLAVAGQEVVYTANVTSDAAGTGPPTGTVQFQLDGQNLGSPVPLTNGTATSPGVALSAGNHGVTASYFNSDGNFLGSTGTLAGGQQVNALTAANLQLVLSSGIAPAIDVSTASDADNAISAINQLPGYSSTPVTVILNLASGSYTDLIASPPAGVTLIINGNGTTTTVVGQSPALIVVTGSVIATGLTFTTATDAPTILVTGGSLMLRNDTIQENSAFTNATIEITGGLLDLGTAASPGGNVLNVDGTGELVHNTTANPVAAFGDTFEVNGETLTASYLSFTGLTSATASAVFGRAVTFTAMIRANTCPGSGTPGGSVDFRDITTNTDLGSVPVLGGIATLSISALAAGSHVVLASYSGDSQFVPSLDSLIEIVRPAIPAIVVSDKGGIYNGQSFPATATVAGVVPGVDDTPSATLEGIGLTLTYYAGTGASGPPLPSAPVNLGIYTVVASYAGSHDYASGSSSNTFIIAPALLVLDPSGNGALNDTGNGSLTVNGGGDIVVDSNNAAAAIITGNGRVSAAQIDVTGGTQTTGKGGFSSPVVHQSPTPDPLGLPLPPPPSTTFAAVNYSGSAPLNLSPGTYVGGIKISGKGSVTLTPGVYFMEGGGFSVTGQGSVSGNGVLLVNAPSKSTDSISLIGQVNVALAPSSSLTGAYAPYDGITIMQDPSSAAPINLTGLVKLALTGVLYAPKALLVITGSGGLTVNSDATSGRAEVIVYDVKETGNGDLTINVDPPTVTIGTPVTTSVPGEPVPLVIQVRDASSIAQAGPLTFTVSFGDGDTKTLAGTSPLIVNHVYALTGTYVVTVTATDEFGSISTQATQSINVAPVAVETDPFNSSLTALFVGTSGNDTIKFAASAKNGVAVTLNGVSDGTFTTSGPLIVIGQGGTDVIDEGSGLNNPAYVLTSPTADNLESDLDNEAAQWAGLTAAVEILNA